MRQRSNFLMGTLVSTAVSAGILLGCEPEREYNTSNGEDGGGQGSSSDAGDANASSDPPDAQNGTGSNTTDNTSTGNNGQLSVTLGTEDASIVDAATNTSHDAEPPSSEPNETDAATVSEAGSTTTDVTETLVSTVPTSSGTSEGSSSNATVETLSSEVTVDAGPDASSDAASDASTDSDGGTDAGPSCIQTAEIESDCANNEDEDCDGLLGCADVDDCGEVQVCQPGCQSAGLTELICDDEDDEDCDGYTDCGDTDCALDAHCLVACVPTTEDCSDGEDNDCDGFQDCADSACAATLGCCVPDDGDAEEVCDDGVDNNCDGVLDCPVILSTVPVRPPSGRSDWEGGAVSADKATVNLETPAQQDYVVQCRSGKPAAVSSQQFVVCDSANPSSLAAKPFPLIEGPNAEHNGLMTSQLRFAYPNGQVSQPVAFTYYVHNSIFGAEECLSKADDEAYFDFADDYLLSDEGATFDDADARLAAPFVNVGFTPAVNATFEVAEGDGVAEYLSLRRRFVLNADKNMILMKRVYPSRTNPGIGCRAATIRKHDSEWGANYKQYFLSACDAVVLNRSGAGLCLSVDDASNIYIPNPTSSTWQNYYYGVFPWLQADNFMWRKLRYTESGIREVFSPKCYVDGSGCVGDNPYALYLPDHDLFEP